MDGANYIGVYIMGVTFNSFSTITVANFERVKLENISVCIFPWTDVTGVSRRPWVCHGDFGRSVNPISTRRHMPTQLLLWHSQIFRRPWNISIFQILNNFRTFCELHHPQFEQSLPDSLHSLRLIIHQIKYHAILVRILFQLNPCFDFLRK